jgi:Ca2+-binding EF-hand superfamily protein
MASRRNIKKKQEDLNEDMKNDLYLGFNLMKNNRGKLSKLKLRSLLFNFVMYKSSPSDINEFINECFPKQEEFSYEEFIHLVLVKNAFIKERDIDDIWSLISTSKQPHTSKNELKKAFNSVGIECQDKELIEMIDYIKQDSDFNESDVINKEDLKRFMN